MKNTRVRSVLAAMVLVLSGCSVSFPQVETARAMFGRAPDIDEQLAEFAWQLSWAADERIVYAVSGDAGTLFVNRDEVQVLFDGDHVRLVAGVLPYGREISIEVAEDGGMGFFEDDVLVLETECGQWQVAGTSDGSVIWEQACSALATPNTKVVAPSGAMARLEYVVHPGYPPIRLVPFGTNGSK